MDSTASTRVAALFEAVLLAPMLRPLVQGLGIAGDYELTVLAQDLAQRDGHGFAAALAEQLHVTP